jgi:thiosulfate/3-mercaptopyruvate sulfurtransferase
MLPSAGGTPSTLRRYAMRPFAPAALAALLLAACADQSPTPPALLLGPDPVTSAARVGEAPPAAVRSDLLVSAEWLAEHLSRPDVAVLHFGTQANYDAGHVPGARFVNLAALQPTRNGIQLMLQEPAVLRAAMEAAGVSTSSHVVVYGDGILQGARGFFILEYLGHPRVALLDGGLATWRAEGRPVSTERAVPSAGSMAPPPRAEKLVTAEWVLDHLDDSEVILIDARPFADYAGTVSPTAALPRPGHIPGAYSLFWQQLIVSTADPRLRDPAALRSLYAATGARMRAPVVTYCTSGMMSSLAYFVARYLGYYPMLYDGSMFEWSPRTDLPVARCGTPHC